MLNREWSDIQEVISEGLEPFVASFFSDRKNDFENLKLYITSNHFELARKVAHNWKGYCEPYGFGHLGIMAGELEKAIVVRDTENINKIVLSIETYFAHKTIPSQNVN